jgi:hypothetical protein
MCQHSKYERKASNRQERKIGLRDVASFTQLQHAATKSTFTRNPSLFFSSSCHTNGYFYYHVLDVLISNISEVNDTITVTKVDYCLPIQGTQPFPTHSEMGHTHLVIKELRKRIRLQ